MRALIITLAAGAALLATLATAAPASAGTRDQVTGDARTCAAFATWQHRTEDGYRYERRPVSAMVRASRHADLGMRADARSLAQVAPGVAHAHSLAQFSRALHAVRIAAGHVFYDCYPDA